MARRVNADLVREAVMNLVKKKIEPTQKSVREEIGYGSNSTLGPLLKELKEVEPQWFGTMGRRSKEIPASHQKAFQDFYDKLYFDIEDAESAGLAKQLEEQLNEALKENEMLEKEINAIKQKNDVYDAVIRSLLIAGVIQTEELVKQFPTIKKDIGIS